MEIGRRTGSALGEQFAVGRRCERVNRLGRVACIGLQEDILSVPHKVRASTGYLLLYPPTVAVVYESIRRPRWHKDSGHSVRRVPVIRCPLAGWVDGYGHVSSLVEAIASRPHGVLALGDLACCIIDV